MSESVDKRIEISIFAKDQSKNEILSVTDSLRNLYKARREGTQNLTPYNMAVERAIDATVREAQLNRAVNRDFQQRYEHVYNTADAMSSFGRVVERVNAAQLLWSNLQIRLEVLQLRLSRALDKQSDALEKYGKESEQYVRRTRDVEAAQKEVNAAFGQLPFTLATNAMAIMGGMHDVANMARALNEIRLEAEKENFSFLEMLGAGFIGKTGIEKLRGFRGRIGSVLGGRFGPAIKGSLLGAGLLGAITLTGRQMAGEELSFGEKLGQVGSFAMTGMMLGSILPGPGHLIGLGVGAAAGFITAFSEEIQNAFAGRGFMSNAQFESLSEGEEGGGTTVNGDVTIIVRDASSASVILDHLERHAKADKTRGYTA